jgi:hypothetical protein
MTRALSLRDLRRLPAVVDLVTAGRAFGIGRTAAYQLAGRDAFPCRVIRVGGGYRVPTADLLRALGVDADEPERPARAGNDAGRSGVDIDPVAERPSIRPADSTRRPRRGRGSAGWTGPP